MATMISIVRPDALDYLSGLSIDPAALPPESVWGSIPAERRRVVGVEGIGIGTDQAATDPAAPFPTEAMLSGLAGEQVPFALQVAGRPDRVNFRLGTWGDVGVLDRRYSALTSLLDSAFPRVDRADATPAPEVRSFPLAAIAYGVPDAGAAAAEAPWDRLLRGLHGCDFVATILAEPVPVARLTQLRDSALEDLRLALAGQNARTDLPLTSAYGEKLESLVASLERAIGVGGWRTAVYLQGDETSFWRLTAGWRGVFAGRNSVTTPLRVLAAPAAARLADRWCLPDQAAPRGPRGWQHPFLNQTLLDTTQLAVMAHFPRLDTPGFAVRPAPAFAVSRPASTGSSGAVGLGDIMLQQKKAGTTYEVELDDLTRHTFVAGLTGSGKTNTLMHLLTEIEATGIPFLVIEPAKTEYRELLGRRGVGDRLRVFTLGREQIAPLRINPFEVPEGIDVATHLDLLKAVFMGSFALWIPLPQVLEQCLVELYTERGWDLTTGRAAGPVTPTVPTLGDLVEAVERTVPKLGYKGESTQEITASLTTRLNSLRRGTRGLMLDVDRSISMAALLGEPTVIELEGLGDDADKAFVMGLLLVRLYEHRRAEAAERLARAAADGRPAPRTGRLSHVVVIEEAHRLLAQSHKATDSYNADPQGAFAEAFAQMLSEVRAYGQGIVIADQVPVRLAPDVVKNTNLKIVHRLVAGDDREAMAEAMAMEADQARMLSTLPQGRAVVFSEGDHTPVVVKIRPAKNLENSIAIDDLAVGQAMRDRSLDSDPAGAGRICDGICPSSAACLAARQLAETPSGRLLGARLLTMATTHPDGLDGVWPDVAALVSARAANSDDLGGRVHGFAVHALRAAISRRAVQRQWTGADVEVLTAAGLAALAERAAGTAPWLGSTTVRERLVELGTALIRRGHDPFPLCSAICPDRTCRFREPVSDVLLHQKHDRYDADLSAQSDPSAYVLQVARYAALDVTSTAPEAPAGKDVLHAAHWRAIACAAQVKFCSADHPRDAARVVREALTSAGWEWPATSGNDQQTKEQ